MTAFTSKKQLRLIMSLLGNKKNDPLKKNILRGDVNARTVVYEFTHGDALKLVGTAAFRFLSDNVKDMKNDELKTFNLGSYRIQIRKHANDVYSGKIDDGLKMIHNFVNKSLPQLTGNIMSLFEWYGEDGPESTIDQSITETDIEDGMNKLVDNYANFNLTSIYKEVENIREEIRLGNAVDLQQAEQRILKIFDMLEDKMKILREKHNSLAVRAGEEIDKIEEKLILMQRQLEMISQKEAQNKTVNAFSSDPMIQPAKVYGEFYSYLPKPQVIIEPSGKITIQFEKSWTLDDQSNFLNDLKAKVVKENKHEFS